MRELVLQIWLPSRLVPHLLLYLVLLNPLNLYRGPITAAKEPRVCL